MGAKNDKTNVMRLLDKAGIEYKVHLFNSEDIPTGSHAADILGIEHERMFKTLVTVAKSGAHYVYMIPVDCELDLKKAAVCAHEKSIEMLKSKDLLPLTGYIHGGCSPIGMKKLFPTFVHKTAQEFDTIVFSGGKVGHMVEVSPSGLLKLVKYTVADITV